MKRIIKFVSVFSFVIASVIAVSSKSYAVPAFARQMGVECGSCHYQQFPLLNQFGRSFKAGGFIMSTQPHVEGDRMYLPNVLNASLVTKVRYQKTNGDSDPKKGTDKGELQFPDEAALLIGGQAGTHVGFLLELAAFTGPDRVNTGEVTGTNDPATNEVTGASEGSISFFASYKMPVVYDAAGTKLSVIPFTTDGLGAAYGFELLNTGAVRNVRPMEHRKEVSAQQYLGTDGASTGIAFVAANDMGFVNITQWAPIHGTNGRNDNSFINYFRLAATPQIDDWDIGVGGQMWSGTTTGTFGETEPAGTEKKAEAWAVDAQAQGAVGSIPLAFYLTHGVAAKTSGGTENIFNDKTRARKATTIATDIGVLPYTQLSLAYRTADNGKATNHDDNAVALGIKYHFAQNIQLSVNHTIKSGNANEDPSPTANDWGGDKSTTFMIFAAF